MEIGIDSFAAIATTGAEINRTEAMTQLLQRIEQAFVLASPVSV